MTRTAREHDPDFYLTRGLFTPKDRRAMEKEDILIRPPLVRTHQDLIEDFKKEGLKFVIANDLETELIARTREKPSHANELAYLRQLFIPESSNLPLANQDALARSYVQELKDRLGLTYVMGGISRITDYEVVILGHFRKHGEYLLKAETYVYPSARTRTRIYPHLPAGPANYVPYIGPYTEAGLRIDILSRDEGDPEVGVWVLLYPSRSPKDI